jgi:hypothetical protein
MCNKILGIESNWILDPISRYFVALSVCIFLLFSLGKGHLSFDQRMDSGRFCYMLLGIQTLYYFLSFCEIEVEPGVTATFGGERVMLIVSN